MIHRPFLFGRLLGLNIVSSHRSEIHAFLQIGNELYCQARKMKGDPRIHESRSQKRRRS